MVLHLLDIHHPLGILHQDHSRCPGKFGGKSSFFYFLPELRLADFLEEGKTANMSFLVAC